MNSLPVTIDFTENIAKKPVNKGADDQSANAGSFEKELNKQEKMAGKDAKSESASQVEESDAQAPVDKNKGEQVAADGTQNGDTLPHESEEEAPSDVLAQNLGELSAEDHNLELSSQIQQSELIVEEDLSSGELAPFSSIVTKNDLKLNVLGESFNVDKLASPDGIADIEVLPEQPVGLMPSSPLGSVAINGVSASSLAGMAEGEAANAPPQPIDKLMTLNQIKASLEAGTEISLDTELDTDAETTIKQAASFNDIQLKESRSALRTYTTSVDVPFSQAEWGEKVNDKIMWLANQKIQYAEIHISPADLGPVEVKINVQNDQAVVTFNSNNQGVRELLELNVHRLREMMGENGVNLSHVDVSDQSSQQQSQDDNQESGATAQLEGDQAEVDAVQSQSIVLDSLVDYYA